MSKKELEILELVLKVGAAAGGFILFFKGFFEYRKANRVKRAEFLDKMISDFNLPDKKTAVQVLDDFGYQGAQFPQNHISIYLRDHRQQPIANVDEVAVRASFDSLLDFLTRLSYYLQNDLISERELIYFRYYLVKVRDNPAVRNYIRLYFYERDFDALFHALTKIA